MIKSNRKRIEQKRAEKALAFVRAGKELDQDKAKAYKAYVKKIPMMIKTNGLSAALAFVFSKGSKNGCVAQNTPYGLIYTQLFEWLEENHHNLFEGNANNDNLIQQIIGLDGKAYRSVTIELLALFTWLKRFADGMIEGEAQEN